MHPGDRRRVYDWAAIQAYSMRATAIVNVREHFGFAWGPWTKAVGRGELKARARTMAIPLLLAPVRSRTSVRRRLLMDGVLENVCSACGIRDWLEKPLSIHIDHINGINNDHRLENLRMLCPNCHSQTPTYSGRNSKRRRTTLQGPAPVL